MWTIVHSGVIKLVKRTAGNARLQGGGDNAELSDRPFQAQFISIQYKIGLNFDSAVAWIDSRAPGVREGKQYCSCKQEDVLH